MCGVCGKIFAAVQGVPSHYKAHMKKGTPEEVLEAEKCLYQFQQANRERKEALKVGGGGRAVRAPRQRPMAEADFEDDERQEPDIHNAPLVLAPSARNCSHCRSRPFSTLAELVNHMWDCLLYTSPSPRDATLSRMPSSA